MSAYRVGMQIPGLGPVDWEADLGWYEGGPVAVPLLGGAPCRVIVRGYRDDPAAADFHAAIDAFLALDRSALTAATPEIFAYYRDVMNDLVEAGDHDSYVRIAGPSEVLDHVRLGREPTVIRDVDGDGQVYVSLECECDWEPEHGLQLVFRDGHTVTKVGPYDGHLTNAAAYDDDALQGVVYRSSR